MKQNSKRLFGAAAAFAMLTVGCSTQENTSKPTESITQPDTAVQQESAPPLQQTSNERTAEEITYSSDISSVFSDRDLDGSYDTPLAVITCSGSNITIEGSGAEVNGTEITITDEGVYLISGTLDDGNIRIQSEGKVQLILENASLSCSDFAPIYVEQAKKCFLTLAEGSENYISDGSTYVYARENDQQADAAIFSADSLTINGSGTLHINGSYNEGIACKDDIVITNGTLDITAVGNGIKGKDYVAIAGGDITIRAGVDGIKASNAMDAGCGYVYVQDGTITIDAQEDGIQAETEVITQGGVFHITSGAGSINAQPSQNDAFPGGHGDFGSFEKQETDTAAVSTKAIKSGTLLYIEGGEFTIDTADDGLHSNAELCMKGGTAEITAGGDGIHADSLADFRGGTIRILKSGEGIEAASIHVSDGTIAVTASDDGFNVSDGTAQGAMGVFSVDCALTISGGSVYINADGDGLDSNGTMLISGGTVIVDGPSNDGNGALDGNGGIQCTGGILIAAGSSGMAEYPDGSQNTAIITLDTPQDANTSVSICDANGKEIIQHTPVKQFNSLIVSSPDFMDGSAYTIYVNGTETGTFTVEGVRSYVGEASGMMEYNGMPGGFHGGSRGEGFMGGDRSEMPTDENGNPAMPKEMQPPQGEQGRFPHDMQPLP